jgi:hypothetical protein
MQVCRCAVLFWCRYVDVHCVSDAGMSMCRSCVTETRRPAQIGFLQADARTNVGGESESFTHK